MSGLRRILDALRRVVRAARAGAWVFRAALRAPDNAAVQVRYDQDPRVNEGFVKWDWDRDRGVVGVVYASEKPDRAKIMQAFVAVFLAATWTEVGGWRWPGDA